MCWKLIIIAEQDFFSPLPMCWTSSYREDLQVQLACADFIITKQRSLCHVSMLWTVSPLAKSIVHFACVEHYHRKTKIIVSKYDVMMNTVITKQKIIVSSWHALNGISTKQGLLCQVGMCWMHISTTNHSKTKIIVSTWHVTNIITTKYVSHCPIGMCWRLSIIAKHWLLAPFPVCWTWSYKGDLRVQLACAQQQYHHKRENQCIHLAGAKHYHPKQRSLCHVGMSRTVPPIGKQHRPLRMCWTLSPLKKDYCVN